MIRIDIQMKVYRSQEMKIFVAERRRLKPCTSQRDWASKIKDHPLVKKREPKRISEESPGPNWIKRAFGSNIHRRSQTGSERIKGSLDQASAARTWDAGARPPNQRAVFLKIHPYDSTQISPKMGEIKMEEKRRVKGGT
jgi:hypothetical protein